MFQLNTGEFNNNLESVNKNIRLADVGLKELAKTLTNALNPYNAIENITNLNQEVAETVRTSLGQTRGITEMMQESFAVANVETLKFGIGLDKNIELFESLNNQIQRNTLLTSQQIIELNILAKNAGISTEQIGGLVEGFDTMGRGINEAIEGISEMERFSRSYGINVSTFMDNVGKNIAKINTYNFEDGVQGLTRMIAKAQALRMNVESTFQVADKLLDPTAAVEFAANMQILGTNVRGLTDPFELMYNAQNDVEALQDDMQELLASVVSFDEATGEFDVSGAARRQLIRFAEQFNMSTEEAVNTAVRGAQRIQKLNIIEQANTSFTPDQKEFIANVAQLSKNPNGSLGLEVQLGDESKNIMELVPDDLKKLRELQDEANLSDRDIAVSQLGYLEDIAGNIKSLGALPTAELIVQGDVEDYISRITEGLSSQVERANVFTQNYAEENLGNQIDLFITTLTDLSARGYETLESNLETILANEALKSRVEILGDVLEGLGEEVQEVITTMDEYERVLRDVLYERQQIDPTYERVRVDSNDTSQIPVEVNPVTPNQVTSPQPLELASAPSEIPVNLVVSGQISLDVNNLVSNFDLDTNELGMQLMRDPAMMAHIAKSISGAASPTGQYGNGIITSMNIG